MFTALSMLMYILREEKDENLEVVLSDSEVIIILGQLREKHCHIGSVWISCQPNNCLKFCFSVECFNVIYEQPGYSVFIY